MILSDVAKEKLCKAGKIAKVGSEFLATFGMAGLAAYEFFINKNYSASVGWGAATAYAGGRLIDEYW